MNTNPPQNDEELLEPDTSPDSSSINIRRVNSIPVYLLGFAVLAFLLTMVVVAMDRANKQQNKEEDTNRKISDSTGMAAKIAGGQAGFITAKSPEPPAITVAKADNLNLPPPPPTLHQPQKQVDEYEQRIQQMKFQQFTNAIQAKTTVPIDAPRSSGSSNGMMPVNAQKTNEPYSKEALAIFKEKIASLQESGIVPSSNSEDDDQDPVKATNDIEQFANKSGVKNRWVHDYSVETPKTLYTLMTGFVIPGILISGINSELPGKIIAQVSENVYDTPTGKYLLIPQGSKLYGEYLSEVVFGQERVLIAWERIIYPDGKALDIGAMPGADSAGYAGFQDQVNHHYVRLFGSALLLSAITAAASYSQQQNQTSFYGNQNSNSVLSQALGQQLGQVTSQLIRKNLNISPTIEIRPGFRFNIIVTKDLSISKPYQEFDY